MKTLFKLLVPIAFFGAGSVLFSQEAPSRDDLEKQVKDLIARISVTDEAARYEPRIAMQDLASQASAPGAEHRGMLIEIFHQSLNDAETPPAARAWIIRQLEYIGGEESVDLLGKIMGSPFHHERELARRALEKNPSEKASAKVRELLAGEHDVNLKRALVHVAGERRDGEAVGLIAELLEAKDAAMRATAAAALGKIASEPAVKALFGAYSKAEEEKKLVLADALLESARRNAKQGDAKLAAGVCRELYDYAEPAYVRAAALRGLVLVSPEEAENVLILALQSKADEVRQSAISAVVLVKDSKVLPNVLAVRTADLEPNEQVMALKALMAVGDRSVAPQLASLVKAKNATVSLGALEALQQLGGLEATQLLLDTASRGGGDLSKAAQAALAQVSGSAVDAALVAAASKGDLSDRAAAMKALGERAYAKAVPVLTGIVEEGPRAMRQAAYEALGQLASGEAVGTLAEAAIKDSDALNAFALASRRSNADASAAESVLRVFDGAGGSEKEALLPGLSLLGGPQALTAVRQLLGYEGIGDVAAKALANWSSADAAPVLIELASEEDYDARRKALYLSGAARLIGGGSIEAEQAAALAQQGLEVAGDSPARSQFISSLGASGSKAAAEPLLSLLNDKETVEEGALALMTLANKLGRSERELRRQLLEAVVNADCDKETIGQAKEALRRRGGRRN